MPLRSHASRRSYVRRFPTHMNRWYAALKSSVDEQPRMKSERSNASAGGMAPGRVEAKCRAIPRNTASPRACVSTLPVSLCT